MQKLDTAVTDKKMYRFLLILSVSVAVGFQGWRTLLNNFAVDEGGIMGHEMGLIQSIREIPGLLVFTVIYIIMILREHRVASYSVILVGIGVAVTGLYPSMAGITTTTLIMSIGFHYYESCNQSLTLQYFGKKESPLVFGKIRSMTALANIGVGVVIWILSDMISYQSLYLTIGVFVVVMGVYTLLSDPTESSIIPQNKKLVFKKKYWLFYVLNILSGARRQIFVVFAVYMLVRKYHYPLAITAAVFILNNIIAYFINPLIGKWINKYGERRMLTVEYLALIVIFSSYIIFEDPIVAGVLYILDHLFFPFSIGIKTWFQKVADPKDIGSSIAVGFAINHIAAVVVPVIGGLLWEVDWRIPFGIGIVLSIISLFFCRMISTEKVH